MKARRLVFAAALAAVVSLSAPAAFADTQQPWDMPGPDSCSMSLLDCLSAGVDAALTVL